MLTQTITAFSLGNLNFPSYFTCWFPCKVHLPPCLLATSPKSKFLPCCLGHQSHLHPPLTMTTKTIDPSTFSRPCKICWSTFPLHRKIYLSTFSRHHKIYWSTVACPRMTPRRCPPSKIPMHSPLLFRGRAIHEPLVWRGRNLRVIGNKGLFDTNEELPNLLIMPATKAADCGVSSTSCCCSYRVGVASSLYSIIQEMGHVDQVPLGDDIEVSPNRYEVHLSFTCAVKLYACIMQHPEKTERKRQLDSMMSVLSFLVVPNDCRQVILERYFEDQNATRGPEPCLNSCSKCWLWECKLAAAIQVFIFGF
jgi:hypothetical protein